MSNERKGAMTRSNIGADRNSCTLFGNSFQQGSLVRQQGELLHDK